MLSVGVHTAQNDEIWIIVGQKNWYHVAYLKPHVYDVLRCKHRVHVTKVLLLSIVFLLFLRFFDQLLVPGVIQFGLKNPFHFFGMLQSKLL